MISLLLLLIPSAEAHKPGLSYAAIRDDELVLTFARPELGALVGLEPEQVSDPAYAEEVAGKVLASLSLSADGADCRLGAPTVAPVENDGVAIRAPLDCPSGQERTYNADILAHLGPGHRHYVEVNGQPEAVLDASAPRVSFGVTPARGEVFQRFLQLGLEHILTGYDHLAFLAGLLLGARNLRAMLLIITSFTLAHSITLSAAALGWIALPAAVVEPAIAASIVWVGVENFLKPNDKRYRLTFALGLIHGFGFAGLLGDLGLPKDGLILALVSFNLGIEVGQGAIAALILPLLLYLRRYAWFERRVLPLGSALVAIAGLVWFIQRVWP